MEGIAVCQQGLFSVPILRPCAIALLGTVAHVVAAGAVGFALVFQQVGFVGWAIAVVLFALSCFGRRSRAPVWALQVGTHDDCWRLLLASGWVPARRLASVRGSGWVSLRFSLWTEEAAATKNMTVTLWRSCLPPVYWRRLYLLAARSPSVLVTAASEAA